MYRKASLIFSAFISLFMLALPAAANDEIDAIIKKVQTPSWDCPLPSLRDELEDTLKLSSLTDKQRFELSAAKGQFLICEGKLKEALTLLNTITSQEDIDTDSYAYASAIYQIGFVYDMREHPTRCEYYNQAQQISSPEKHSDIFTSASLGLITYCSDNADEAERLSKMFNVLQRYSDDGSPAELAHIHNSIGLLYGDLEQHALAAEQYIKAHEMGLKVYKGSNKLSILISAIVSLLASGQTDEAYQRILEYGSINSEVNTPLTNYYYQYALSFYYRKTKNYSQLAYTLPDFKEAGSKVSSSLAPLFYNWHKTEVCLYNNDLACVQDYLDSFGGKDVFIPVNFRTNLDYLSFNLAMYIALGDLERAKLANEVFSAEAEKRRIMNQDSARILSAADLRSRIYNLESEIEAAERLRQNTLFAAVTIFVLISLIAGYVLRKKHLASKAIDPITQLLNADTAISRINALDTPKPGRAIAIAIFDISNLREITGRLGVTKSDAALRQIAQTLQNTTRGNDILGRFGTEQFILCLHNIEERSARSFFERMQAALDTTFDNNVNDQHISVDSKMSIFIANEKISDLNDILNELVMSIDMNSRVD
jgi:diguanylate cyclase (GGDEF)-like protein